MKIIKINRNVHLKEDLKSKSKSFYSIKPFTKVDSVIINFIKKFSKDNNFCDVRVCMHKNLNSIHHDMIMLHQKKNFYPPHFSNFTSDTYIVLEGKLAIFIFNKKGRVIKNCMINNGELFRAPKSKFHCIFPISNTVLFYEMRSGPYKKNDIFYPSWAPNRESDKIDIATFKSALVKILI